MPVLCREALALTDDDAVLRVFEEAGINVSDLLVIEHERPEYNRLVVAGVDAYNRYSADRKALRAAQDKRAEEIRSRGGFMAPRQRDDMLCDMQRRHFSAGLREFKLSTNIYGWCVEKTTNLGGGAHAQTRRGMTKAEAIAWGIKWASEDPTRRYFTVYAEYLTGLLEAA